MSNKVYMLVIIMIYICLLCLYTCRVPMIPIHHMEAHALTARMMDK